MLKTTALCGKSNKHGGSFPHMPFKQTMLSGKIYWHHFQWQRVLLHYAKNSKCKNLIQSRLADLDYMLIMILKIYLRKGKKIFILHSCIFCALKRINMRNLGFYPLLAMLGYEPPRCRMHWSYWKCRVSGSQTS